MPNTVTSASVDQNLALAKQCSRGIDSSIRIYTVDTKTEYFGDAFALLADDRFLCALILEYIMSPCRGRPRRVQGSSYRDHRLCNSHRECSSMISLSM